MFGKFLDSEEVVDRKGMSKGEKSEEGDLGLWRRRHVTDSGFNVICTAEPWKVDRVM